MLCRYSEFLANGSALRDPKRRRETRCIDAVTDHNAVRTVKMLDQLRGNESGDCRKRGLLTSVDNSLKRHYEPIIQPPMKKARPACNWRITKSQTREHLQEEFVKNNVNRNSIGIECVNPRGIHDVKLKSMNLSIPPAPNVIGKKPPNITDQMRPANGRDFVPKDAARRRTAVANHTREILHALGIDVNLDSLLSRESLELFNDAAFCAVAAIQKRRNDSEPQD